jgi:hypothetical protein
MKQTVSKLAEDEADMFLFQPTTRRYIPEDRTLHNRCCENLKYYIFPFYRIFVDQQVLVQHVENNYFYIFLL